MRRATSEDDVGGYWPAPVRLTKAMLARMMPELAGSCGGTREDREAILRAIWAEARFASPARGEKVPS